MPATCSKEEDEEARRKAHVKALLGSVFQSVVQHVITLQSEPNLVRELCKGDAGRTASLLANTSGLVGILSLFLNQAGGRATDALGRKPGLLLGPIGNVILGMLVFGRSNSLSTVLVCRVLRMIITTFSNSVVVTSSLMDVCSGKQMALAGTQMGATIGVGVVLGPILESIILQRFKHPRFAYLAMSFLAMAQTLYNVFVTEETHEIAKRTSISAITKLQNFNPFGFLNIYTRGSKPLQDLVTVTSLQMALEGKNISDLGQIWQRNHMKWDVPEIRNFIVAYGILCIVAGGTLSPYLLKSLSPLGYTNLTNATNGIAYLLRVIESPKVYVMMMPFLLPGVNGQAAAALNGIRTDLANREQFGKGEFSAYTNNLRALVGTASTMIYGNWYAMCAKRGIPCGTTWWTALFIGVLLPQYIAWKTQCAQKAQELLNK